MKKLTHEQLLSDLKYGTQQIYVSVFVVAALFYILLESFSSYATIEDRLLSMGMALLLVGIPIGYFAGIRQLYSIRKKYKRVKKLDFYILEKTIIDKTMLGTNNTKTYCQLVFGENDGYWVTRKIYNMMKKGSTCYVFYFKKDRKEFAIYNKLHTELSEELKELIIQKEV